MDNTPTDCAAVHETVVFLNYFKDLHDPRQQGKVCYPLEEVLLLCSARGPGRGGDHHRDSHLWREEAGAAAPLPFVP